MTCGLALGGRIFLALLTCLLNRFCSGIVAASGSLTARSLQVKNNSVQHPLFAAGGGFAAAFGTAVTISDSSFHNNSVSGLLCGGAGIVALEPTTIVNLTRCAFEANAAVVVGTCSQSIDEKPRCALSAGAGVLVAYGTMRITSSMFDSNVASCSSLTFQCRVGGAAVASLQSGTVEILHSDFFRNGARSGGSDGSISNGGAFFCESGRASVSDTVFDFNFVDGPGGGGGISVSGSCIFTSVHSTFSNNIATSQAGAGWLTGTSNTTISATRFVKNSASQVGGALLMTLDAQVRVLHLFENKPVFLAKKKVFVCKYQI